MQVRRRRPIYSLPRALAAREAGVISTAAFRAAVYTAVVPSSTFIDVTEVPNVAFRRFTPCGRYLVATADDARCVVVFRVETGGRRHHSPPSYARSQVSRRYSSAMSTSASAYDRFAYRPPEPALLLHRPLPPAPHSVALEGDTNRAHHQLHHHYHHHHQQQQQQQREQHGLLLRLDVPLPSVPPVPPVPRREEPSQSQSYSCPFPRFFTQLYAAPIATGGDSLVREFCLVTRGARYLILASCQPMVGDDEDDDNMNNLNNNNINNNNINNNHVNANGLAIGNNNNNNNNINNNNNSGGGNANNLGEAYGNGDIRSSTQESHALSACPVLRTFTLHLVDIETGRVDDRFRLYDDYVQVDGHAGIHLRGDTLCVLSVRFQTVHVMRVQESLGRFAPHAAVGYHCFPDDALTIATARDAEAAWQARRAARQRANASFVRAGAGAGAGVGTGAGIDAGTGAGAGAGGGTNTSSTADAGTGAGASAGHGGGGMAAAAAAATARVGGGTSSSSAQDGETGLGNGRRRSGFYTGLMQRLLVYLYRRLHGEGRQAHFYQVIGQYSVLLMHKVQLLDDDHLLIRLGTYERGGRPTDAATNTCFLVVYCISTGRVLNLFENRSLELIALYERFRDVFVGDPAVDATLPLPRPFLRADDGADDANADDAAAADGRRRDATAGGAARMVSGVHVSRPFVRRAGVAARHAPHSLLPRLDIMRGGRALRTDAGLGLGTGAGMDMGMGMGVGGAMVTAGPVMRAHHSGGGGAVRPLPAMADRTFKRTRAALAVLPFSSQARNVSPYLERALFSYNADALPALDGTRALLVRDAKSFKFCSARSGAVRFKLAPAPAPAPAPLAGAVSAQRTRMLFLFHPRLPLVISMVHGVAFGARLNIHVYGHDQR